MKRAGLLDQRMAFENFDADTERHISQRGNQKCLRWKSSCPATSRITGWPSQSWGDPDHGVIPEPRCRPDRLDLRDALKHRRDVLQHVSDALKQREPSDAALRFFACTY